MQWFRFYSEALDDPKVQRLPGDLFKAWVNLLCLANEQEERGTLPTIEDIAFRLRLDDGAVADLIGELVRRELLEYEQFDRLVIHAWDKRQYDSDTSTERVRKFRQKQRETAKETKRNKSETFQKRSSNAIEQNRVDTDTEAEQKQSKEERKGGAARATLAPDVFPITDAMRDWATTNAPGVDVDLQTRRFLDRNRAEGKTYKDWPAAWRNWITSPYSQPTARAPAVRAAHTGANGFNSDDAFASNVARIDRMRREANR